MKTTIFYSIPVLFLSFFFLPSCTTEDPTPSPADPRASYSGKWLVTETWNKNTFEATISVDAGSSNGVSIDNFAGAGTGVATHAIVSGSTITISPVPQTLSNGWIIESGSGFLQGTTKINWSYVFNDVADQISAIAVYTKKK